MYFHAINKIQAFKGLAAHLGVSSLIAGAVMISLSGVWVKVAHVAPSVSAFYRVFFGGIVLLGASLSRRELKRPVMRQLLSGLLCGFMFAANLWLYHRSIQYIGPGLGTILPNFQVFILAAFGVLFLKEPLRRTYLLSLPMAFVGLFMIVGIQWSHLEHLYRIGVYYGLGGAICYAGFLLLLRKLQAEQMGVSFFYVLMMVSFATAIFLAAEIIVSAGSFLIPDLQSFWALAALGLLSQSAGWILITNALPSVRASLSGLILLLQPALAFVWDVWFFQRATSPANWAGVGVALAAIYLGMAGKRPAAAKR
jgi:drug/metabolite transporter (DMT)-like permease